MGGAWQALDYRGSADLERIIAGRVAYPARTHRERYPAVGRLRLLVASRLHEPERYARVWDDATGKIAGFAALLQRAAHSPRLSLERVVDPWAYGIGLGDETLAWALDRLHELAGELGLPATMDVTAGADDPAEAARLSAAGFELLDVHPLYLARDLTLLLPESSAPDGFIVRPLAGERELPAYTALYDATFTPIAPACRRALLADSDHTHFVAVEVGAGGAIAAFCECGVQPEEWEHLGARVGWVEYVGTAPAARGRGLGYAVTLAGLHWLRDRGCDVAMLVTGEGNATARRLYERLGFTVAAREDVWQVTVAHGDAQ
jgi:mycothiol synthase